MLLVKNPDMLEEETGTTQTTITDSRTYHPVISNSSGLVRPGSELLKQRTMSKPERRSCAPSNPRPSVQEDHRDAQLKTGIVVAEGDS
jgi:hypothetical protein